jgi:hypothetical protein
MRSGADRPRLLEPPGRSSVGRCVSDQGPPRHYANVDVVEASPDDRPRLWPQHALLNRRPLKAVLLHLPKQEPHRFGITHGVKACENCSRRGGCSARSFLLISISQLKQTREIT